MRVKMCQQQVGKFALARQSESDEERRVENRWALGFLFFF